MIKSPFLVIGQLSGIKDKGSRHGHKRFVFCKLYGGQNSRRSKRFVFRKPYEGQNSLEKQEICLS